MRTKRLLFFARQPTKSSYSVDFSRGSLGDLHGINWGIDSNGNAVVNPTELATLIANGDFETGSPPNSWTLANGAVLTADADAHAGSQAIKVARNNSAYPLAVQNVTVPANPTYHWGRFRGYSKRGDANHAVVVSNSNLPFMALIHSFTDTSYVARTVATPIVGGAGAKPVQVGSNSAVNGTFALWDDVSFVPLMDLAAGMQCAIELMTVKINVAIPIGEAAAVWICGDSTNPSAYIFFAIGRYQDTTAKRGSAFLGTVVNNVLTKITSVSPVTYTNDGTVTVELRRTATGTVQMWFNNAQVGTDQTITPGIGQFVGMLATGGGTAVSAFSLADCVTRAGLYAGTSITAGNVAAGLEYVSLVNLYLRWSAKPQYSFTALTNAGVGGSTSWHALARVANTFEALAPDVVCIEYGVNDTDSTFYAKTEEALIRRLRARLPNARIVFLCFPRVGNAAVNDATNLNAAIAARWAAICAAYGVMFVDYASYLDGLVDGGATLASLMNDTVHPSEEGHRSAAALVRDALLAAYGSGPMPTLPDRIYDCEAFEATPNWRTGVANDGETGTWTTAGSARSSSVANSTIRWTATCTSFGFVRTAGATGTVAVSIDGGAETNYNLSTYGISIVYSTELSAASHTVTFRVVSGTVGIEYFISI